MTYLGMEKVWDMIPEVACDGRCADYCCAVPMTRVELSLVRGKIPWYPNTEGIAERMARDELRCPALTANGRCGVYEVRPTVCRIFGNAESLPCPYGCEPPKLTRQQASDIMDRAREVGGDIA